MYIHGYLRYISLIISKLTTKVRILNIDIDNFTFSGFMDHLTHGVVFTPNVDHLMKLQKDREFYEVYQKADFVVCDSQILKATSGLVSQQVIVDQIAGSDFFPAFCQHHRGNTDRIRIFLLGGTEESVKKAAENINQRAGSEVVIGGYSPPFGFEHDEAETQRIIERINDSVATVLAVGVGAPKQEKWIIKHRDQLPGIDIFFAIGATIDFQAGLKKRSPKWVTKMGLEWLHRLASEPRRLFKRYMVDGLPYFYLLVRQRMGWYRNPFE